MTETMDRDSGAGRVTSGTLPGEVRHGAPIHKTLPDQEISIVWSPQRLESLVEREVDGELVVYDLDRQRLHVLNPTAAVVWRLCDGKCSRDAIASTLSEHFPENLSAIQDDVAAVLQLFAAEGLLELSTGPGVRSAQ